MNKATGLGLAMLSGTAIGATAIDRLNAQVKSPGAYAIVDITLLSALGSLLSFRVRRPASLELELVALRTRYAHSGIPRQSPDAG